MRESLYMINELTILVNSLESIGKTTELVHRDISKPGGKEALRVVLGENATIESLEYISKKQLDFIWELKSSNHDRFPTAKLDMPLKESGNKLYVALEGFKSAKGSSKETARKKLAAICKQENESVNELAAFKDYELAIKLIEKYPNCTLPDKPKWPKNRSDIEQRAKIFSKSDDPNIQVIYGLYQRYLRFGNNGLDLLKQLEQKAVEMMNGDNANLNKLLMRVLFGSKLPADNVLLVLDYLPDKDYEIFATNKRYYEKSISKCLIEREKQSSNQLNQGCCPILGASQELINDKFPQISLGKGKSVSQIIPYSKFTGNAAFTVERYGKSGIESYTIDKALSQKFQSVLEILTNEESRGKTWRSIPAENGKTEDLLVAYCRSVLNCSVIDLVADADENHKNYQKDTKDVLALYEKGNLKPHDLVDFFIFRKIDNGRQKIVYTSTQQVKNLCESRNHWDNACKNVPPVELKIKVGKEKKKPSKVSPLKVVYLSTQTYCQDSELLKKKIPAISFSDTMKIFFDVADNQQVLAKHSLTRLCTQYQFLFAACHLSKILKKQIDYEKNNIALQITTLFGILLSKLGRSKETYMNEYYYQLGQLFSAMDVVHFGYCMQVRNKQIPSQLLGSACYSIALKNPSKALEIFAERLSPYASWATKLLKNKEELVKLDESIREPVKNAIHTYNWMKSITPKIHKNFEQELPLGKSNHKAELMLGYLAGRPFESKENSDSKD